MAEIALGGIQIAVRSTRRTARTCAHTETLSTVSMGVERVVCEMCGHLSVNFHKSLSGPVDRESFARPADEIDIDETVDDELAVSPTARYSFGGSDDEPVFFAHRPHMRIQRRPEREHRVLTLRG